MKLEPIVFILLGCFLSSCSEDLRKSSAIVDPDPNYILGVLLKQKLDSSSVYSDTLIAEEIKWVREEIDLQEDMILKPIRVDSLSYEVLIRPYHFPKFNEAFYLVTQDSVYILEPVKYNNSF